MKNNNDELMELELGEDTAETRVYELGFHIDADLPQEEAKKTYQAIRETIASAGQVVAEGEPEKIPLAYTISRKEHGGRRDFNSSFFAWIAYEADGKGHDAVTTAIAAESRVFRFIDLRTTKDAAKHSEEIREVYARLQEKQADDEEVSEVELDAALKEAGVA